MERTQLQERLPDFVKGMWNNAMDAVSKIEEDFQGFLNRMVEHERLSEEEAKRILSGLIDRFHETRQKIETRASESLDKTWLTLNLPTKSEVDALGRRVATLRKKVVKLQKEVRKAA